MVLFLRDVITVFYKNMAIVLITSWLVQVHYCTDLVKSHYAYESYALIGHHGSDDVFIIGYDKGAFTTVATYKCLLV